MKRAAVLWLGLLATLVAVNMTVWGYEKLRLGGTVILLELAPKDPRSLMQGDYMALRLKVAREVLNAERDVPGADASAMSSSLSGFVIVQPDERNVGQFVRVQPSAQPRGINEIALPYRRSRDGVEVVTGAFFFEEGRATDFDAARYGEFRVDEAGQAILTGMRDADLQPL